MTASLSYLQNAIENGGTVRGINAKGQGGMPRKKIDTAGCILPKIMVQRDWHIIAIQEDGTVQVFICQIYDRRADESP